jgi:acetyltransferase
VKPVAPPDAVFIRRIRTSDVADLERFYRELPLDSLESRFLGATRGLSHLQATSFCTPDHGHDEGFVAVAEGPDGREAIVAHLCMEPVCEATAEIAVAVADVYQRRGIGRRLVAAGVRWARHVGIRHLTATMYVGNVPIQRLLASLGLPMRTRNPGAGVCEVVIDLEPGATEAA